MLGLVRIEAAKVAVAMVGVLGLVALGACSSSGSDDDAASAPTSTSVAPSTTTPTTETVPAPGPGVPSSGMPALPATSGGPFKDYLDEHEVFVDWYAGDDGNYVAVVRGLDPGELPPTCITTSYSPELATPPSLASAGPLVDGGCDGTNDPPATVEPCHDAFVLSTEIPVATAGDLFAELAQSPQGNLIPITGATQQLAGVPSAPPFTLDALGC